MNKRILVPLALLVAAAPTLAACGGGSSGEDKITEAIETAATTSKPGNCTELQTRRFNEQNSDRQGKAATEACEEEAEEGTGEAEGVSVSNISVDGQKATAEVALEGGSLDSQTVELALVEEDGGWKLDQVEGFVHYDGKTLGKAFEKSFEEHPEGVTAAEASCIAGEIAKASQAQAEELFFGGSAKPIVELTEACS